MTAPASLSAAKAYLERIRLAAERTGMTECETLLDEMVATFEEAAREREGMREALEPFANAAAAAERSGLPANAAVFRAALDYDMRSLGRDNSEDVYRDSVTVSDLVRLANFAREGE